MREDASQVFLRHRNELLKAIFDGVDGTYEVGNYLLSKRNMENHGLSYNMVQSDLICDIYSNLILRKEEGDGGGTEGSTSKGQPGAKKGTKLRDMNLSRMLQTHAADHPWLGRVKESWLPEDNQKHNTLLHRPGEDNTIPLSMKHGLWPEVIGSGEVGDYMGGFPFDEQHHPMRRRNAVTGQPEWVRQLREFYFSDDDSPSLAEQLMEKEKAHESHHMKLQNPLYTGIKQREYVQHFTDEQLDAMGQSRGSADIDEQGRIVPGEKRYSEIRTEHNHPFIGNGKKTPESTHHHLHTIRLADFERWKEEQGEERLKELSDEGKDLELAHFDDRMEKLMSNDIKTVRKDPTRGMTDSEIAEQAGIDPEALEIQEIHHGEGMGWPTWNLGLEFLPPTHRTAVLEHIYQHGTQSERAQTIELPDGTKMPMSRIEKNKKIRNEPEFDWWNRDSHHHGANTHKHMENIDTDSTKTGQEGLIKAALNETVLDTYYKKPTEAQLKRNKNHPGTEVIENAHDRLRHNIADMFEGDANVDEHITNLFPYQAEDKKYFDDGIASGKEMLDLLKKKIHPDSDVLLTKEGLLDLVGYDENLDPKYEPGEHPHFDAWTEPLLEKEYMERILANLEHRMSLAKKEKTIRNAAGPLRVNLNGPHPDDVSAAEKSHYFDDNGKLRGWGWTTSKPFTHTGGVGRTGSTYNDIMHHFLSFDGGDTSLYGHKDQDDYLSTVEPHTDTASLFSSWHYRPLPTDVVANSNAMEIMSKFDATQHMIDRKRVGRNLKNNSSDTKSSFAPGVMNSGPRLELGRHDPKDYLNEVAGKGKSFQRDLGGGNSPFVSNAYTKSGGTISGDTSVLDSNALKLRILMASGHMSPPHTPSTRLHVGYADVYRNPLLSPTQGMSHPEFLAHLGDAGRETGENVPGAIDLYRREAEGDYTVAGGGHREFGARFWGREGDEGKPPLKPLSPHHEYADDIANLEDRLISMRANNPNDVRIRDVQMELDRVKQIYYDAEMKDLDIGNSPAQKQTNDFEAKLEADKVAKMNYGRKLLNMAIEHDPSAFDPSNPIQFLHNVQRLWYDSNRGLWHDDDHDLNTMGHSIDENATMRSTGDKLGASPHKTIAAAMSSMENEIHSDMKPKDAAEILGLPTDERHLKHVEDYLQSIRTFGPVKAASMGQIAAMGLPLLPDQPDMFNDLAGIEDMYTHLDNKIKEYKGTLSADERKRISRNKSGNRVRQHLQTQIGPYNAMGSLMRLTRLTHADEMDAYGLSHFPHSQPLHPSTSKTGWKTEANKRKDMMSNIITFNDDGGQLDLAGAEMAEIKKPLMDFMSTRIRNLDSMEGNTVHDSAVSASIDGGYHASPTIGFEYERGGTPVAGSNPHAGNYPSVPLPVWHHWFGQDMTQQVLGSIDPNDPRLAQTNPASSLADPTTGETHINRNPLQFGKADIPKKMPLIDPLHRIFAIEDMNQLRGFTGEWVVSTHVDGDRYKVTKKNNRVVMVDEDNTKQSMNSEMRQALKEICKKDYTIDVVVADGVMHVNDIMMYDDGDVTDLTTRERVKLLRGQFDSYDPVHLPSPSDIKITDEVGLQDAVKALNKDSEKILLRDAKSTYMKGEDKHPKWVLLAKEDIDYHVSFGMEIDNGSFILHLPEDLVKYEIVNGEAQNPIAAIGSLTDSDYSLKLAKSLQPYWEEPLQLMLKEETEIEGEHQHDTVEPEIDEEKIEEESAGILKPKKDKNLLLKPRELVKTVTLIERALERLEKSGGVSNMHGRGLGIDVGGQIESPRGPTTLNAEQSLPDWDMKERPKEDMEKPEDYPGRKRKKAKTSSQYNESGDRNLER